MAILEDRKGDNPNAVFGNKGKKGKTWKGGANGQGDESIFRHYVRPDVSVNGYIQNHQNDHVEKLQSGNCVQFQQKGMRTSCAKDE